MIDPAHESSAKHRDSFFLEEKEGVFIVSETFLKKEHEYIQKKKDFLFSQRQEMLEVAKQRVFEDIRERDLEKHEELETKRDLVGVMCMACEDESEDGVFLFPICEEAHHYACLECLDSVVENNNLIVCPECREKGDTFWKDKYRKAIGENNEGWLRLRAPITQYQTPTIFSLTQNLPNETIFLTDQTTVTLSNIEISEKLFFVLLEKTRVIVGGSFSITEHVENEDWIREHDIAREAPLHLKRNGAVSSLALENIERMQSNSIGCVLKEVNLTETDLINILPKLRIREDSGIEWLRLTAERKEHVAGILKEDQIVFVWRVKTIDLEGYAVSILPKLIIHKDNMIERLSLNASEEEHVAAVLEQDPTVCVGRVKRMDLGHYAVSILPKLRTHENSGAKSLGLRASRKEHVAAVLTKDQPFCVGIVKNMKLKEYAVCVITKIRVYEDCGFELLKLSASKEEHVAGMLTQDQTFYVGRVEKILLEGYAVGILPKLRIHKDCAVESISLSADEEEHVAEILTKDQPFFVGEAKSIWLKNYAVRVVTKTTVHENSEVEWLGLYASKEEHVAEILEQDRTVCVGKVKNMGLSGYAVSILPKLRTHGDNTMKRIVWDADEKYFSRILEEGDNSIELGRIRQFGFDSVPEKIRRKLRYTIVDGEGKEVLKKKSTRRRKILPA
ncbi:MAG: uncharacterized protein A8A55_1485 [Amphiamblys sp. WSBS2006]|nr:MAG: uncharacterized protein A8A55_1485 [Amphiamblys sp. WSBS2006]